MDYSAAKNVMSSLLECQRALDKALEATDKIEVDNEKKAIEGVIKNAIGDILTDAINAHHKPASRSKSLQVG